METAGKAGCFESDIKMSAPDHGQEPQLEESEQPHSASNDHSLGEPLERDFEVTWRFSILPLFCL